MNSRTPVSAWLSARIEQAGFALVPGAVPATTLDELLSVLAPVASDTDSRRRGGARNLFETVPRIRELARSGAMREAAEAVLGPACFAVRALLFVMLMLRAPGPAGAHTDRRAARAAPAPWPA